MSPATTQSTLRGTDSLYPLNSTTLHLMRFSLFKHTMRIPKRPVAAFSWSLFTTPPSPSPIRVRVRFISGVLHSEKDENGPYSSILKSLSSSSRRRRSSTSTNQDEWWMNFGIDDLELQNLAIHILSQTCSSSRCERNWSVFERIHTKRRNRLEHKRLNDLVYTHYNLRLKERQSSRKSLTDLISLENIDLTDDWVVEAEDDDAPLLDVNEIDDWMDVADAILDEGEGGAAADEWWMNFGIDDPALQNLAIRIPSQTCSSSGCERNWSVFERIHTKRRSRLEHKRLNDLVYTHYNLRLKERIPFSSPVKKGKKKGQFDRGEEAPSGRTTCGLILAYGRIPMLGANQPPASTTMGDDSISKVQHCAYDAGTEDHCLWSSLQWGRKIPMGKHVFCNRSLNMKNIVAVGFDMDYTLAQYKPETFESLAYNGTIRKLVYNLGYPPELLEWSFDWKYMVRGLVLDKKRGNILKMDRHKYVKVAYHGFREMSKEDKLSTYGNTLLRDSFDEPDYALIDTLFSLAEAYLFAQLVDLKDRYPGKIPDGVDYCRMYKDVRAAVDLCHRDGTLKQMVAKDPGKYISEDPAIVPMIKMLRDSGRATFLVTNSLWDYTNVVMNFLCGFGTMDNSSFCNYSWLENFDVVITGSSKPSFFHEENRANLFEVDPESGMLLNTDNGTLLPQIGNTSPGLPRKGLKKSCRVFQGGSVGHLHKLLSIEASSQVLYVGDHIYGDILRSKKVLGWRTMLVVPELEKELELLWETRDIRKELHLLRKQRDVVEDKIHHLNWSLKFEGVGDVNKKQLSCELNELEPQREYVRQRHQQVQRECHQKFHKIWGQLMKTGYQNSRFAHQVERFACLYTSQVTNLGFYSPDKYYRTSEDFMPHEFEVLDL